MSKTQKEIVKETADHYQTVLEYLQAFLKDTPKDFTSARDTLAEKVTMRPVSYQGFIGNGSVLAGSGDGFEIWLDNSANWYRLQDVEKMVLTFGQIYIVPLDRIGQSRPVDDEEPAHDFHIYGGDFLPDKSIKRLRARESEF